LHDGCGMKHIAVIGAGAAGLAAAWSLVEGGKKVTLLEREAVPGGKLRTEHIDNAYIDAGVQLISSTYTSFLALARAAGADTQLQRSPGRDALWRKGRVHEITYGSVPSMLTSGALPTTLKLKLGAKYVPWLSTQARGLDANDPAHTGGSETDTESIAAWGRREMGNDFVDLLVAPLLAAYYGSLAEETTAPVYHALARVGMDVSVMGATRGFGSVAATIVSALQARGAELRLDTVVTDVRAHEEGVDVGSDRFDGAVVAVPARAARELLHATGALAAWLAAVRARPSFAVCLRMDKPYPGDYFGLSLPSHAEGGARVAALCVQSRKVRGLVPDGDALVALPAPHAVPAMLERTDAEIVAEMLSALEHVVTGITRRVVSSRVIRFADAYSLFGVGHLRAIRAFDRAWLPPNVVLAGDYLMAPTVEGAVRSGRRAADQLLRGS
jgi:oxygen-dependent protoporphyrinogen oxidase